jgi:2-desacetyl-2-hydroxyethyl bacteriochlorophyllide A dehydrogenase
MRQSVIFTGLRTIQIEETPIPRPDPGEVLVKTIYSAISAGTELLVYRNQFPDQISVDATIEGMADRFSYPLAYGYAAVGQVVQCGDGIDPAAWQDQLVFAFHPHCSHFTAPVEQLISIPHDIPPEDAVFAPNMETAINLVQDGCPLLGERVIVLGQGVVGLLTTALLAQFPLEQLTAVDELTLRREVATAAGADQALSPGEISVPFDADLVYEVTGNPDALNTAVDLTGFGGRIVIGSCYGQKTAPVYLGGHFHRSRIKIISSQVSTIAPALRGRWTKSRRFEMVWEMIRQITLCKWITHRIPITRAVDAYRLLDERAQDTIQVVLTY